MQTSRIPRAEYNPNGKGTTKVYSLASTKGSEDGERQRQEQCNYETKRKVNAIAPASLWGKKRKPQQRQKKKNVHESSVSAPQFFLPPVALELIGCGLEVRVHLVVAQIAMFGIRRGVR